MPSRFDQLQFDRKRDADEYVAEINAEYSVPVPPASGPRNPETGYGMTVRWQEEAVSENGKFFVRQTVSRENESRPGATKVPKRGRPDNGPGNNPGNGPGNNPGNGGGNGNP